MASRIAHPLPSNFLVFASTLFACTSAVVLGPWSDPLLPADARADLLLKNMTLAEKMSLLHGISGVYVGNVPAISRLGIPPINMNDGPQGFRDEHHKGTSTSFPSGMAVAATFDPSLVEEWGRAMGTEFRNKGSNVQLGPGVCLARVPRNGRNFEYLSGEDPFLGYTMAGAAVRGIQSQKVVANAKHWVLNNQESNRLGISAEADERTRHEMYYPPFEGAIEAGVGSFMCSYNKVNGVFSCENPDTLKGDLKGKLGFKGYVMSDWGAAHSTSIMQGLDNEQPGSTWMDERYLSEGLLSGVVTEAALDDSVRRILWSMYSVGVMDEPPSTWDPKKLSTNVTTLESLASARRISSQSTVLLKNSDGILPLPQGSRLALIGLAGDNAIIGSTGSGNVYPSYVVTPLAGIKDAADSSTTVLFDDGTNLDTATKLAASADYSIVFVGNDSTEGRDRPSLSLSKVFDDLISAVARVSKRVIVVATVPGAILMPWSNEVSAILTNFMPGQQVGPAIADVLFGKVNPCAKSPITFPNRENELEFTDTQYPGIKTADAPEYVFYNEKLLVGYRFYEAHDIPFTTGFPFGHGLSYTSFSYDDLSISTEGNGNLKAKFAVQNSGKLPGCEIAQVYLVFPADSGEPPLQLKGFHKTRVLKPGETEVVRVVIRPRGMSIWDVSVGSWRILSGKFRVKVGSSSRDIRISTTIELNDELVELTEVAV